MTTDEIGKLEDELEYLYFIRSQEDYTHINFVESRIAELLITLDSKE